jgi:CMP-N,N'-diacetyllegionaminic acid synthase
MSKKITAMIAVRSGSKRVPNKNIRPFCETSLLDIKVKQLSRSGLFDQIVVSSDCEKMLDISGTYHGVASVKRPSWLATDDVPMNDVYEYLASLADNDHVCFVHVTSPLLKDSSLQSCVKEYLNMTSDFDSLATVTKLKEYIWHNGVAVNYDPNNHPRSQDLPDYCALNFAVNIIGKRNMIDRRNIVGSKFKPFFLSSEESVDVDTMLDFEFAQLLYRKKNARI